MKFVFVLLMLALAGCASNSARSTEYRLPAGAPQTQMINTIPFIDQTAGYCGPATLTMVMNWAGRPVTVEQMAPLVYTPGAKGSLQTDMISAGRRQGMMTVPIEGFSDLLKEVADGNPVIVFENLGLSWLPQWHYAVVIGYDLNADQIFLHSGHESFLKLSFRRFRQDWNLAQNWGLVILPPGRLPSSADEAADMNAAAALEQGDQKQAAQASYQAILARWPDSQGAAVGLANLAYKDEDFKSAIGYLTAATKSHPNSAALWHNLAIAQNADGELKPARTSAQRAVDLASPADQPTYRDNLKEILE